MSFGFGFQREGGGFRLPPPPPLEVPPPFTRGPGDLDIRGRGGQPRTLFGIPVETAVPLTQQERFPAAVQPPRDPNTFFEGIGNFVRDPLVTVSDPSQRRGTRQVPVSQVLGDPLIQPTGDFEPDRIIFEITRTLAELLQGLFGPDQDAPPAPVTNVFFPESRPTPPLPPPVEPVPTTGLGRVGGIVDRGFNMPNLFRPSGTSFPGTGGGSSIIGDIARIAEAVAPIFIRPRGGGGGTAVPMIQGFPAGRAGGRALPGGLSLGPESISIPNPLSGMDLTPGFRISDCPGTSPFGASRAGARPQLFFMQNPTSGRITWFRPAGRPILFSGDVSAAKRVRKVAARARRARGGR